MAEINRGFSWLYNMRGGQMQVMELPVKISQTIYRGTVLCLSDTSGSVRVVADADTSLYGVALHSKTTSATQKTETIQLVPFAIGAVFEAVGAASTMTMAANNPAAGAYRNLHADIKLPTAAYSRIDTGAATLTLRIVGWDKRTENETGAGRKWRVTIAADASQVQTTQSVGT